MLAENQLSFLTLTPVDGFWWILKVGIIIMATFYFIFSLIVLRQVNLMTETIITEASGFLRALSIVHAGLALGIIILFIGLLFG